MASLKSCSSTISSMSWKGVTVNTSLISNAFDLSLWIKMWKNVRFGDSCLRFINLSQRLILSLMWQITPFIFWFQCCKVEPMIESLQLGDVWYNPKSKKLLTWLSLSTSVANCFIDISMSWISTSTNWRKNFTLLLCLDLISMSSTWGIPPVVCHSWNAYNASLIYSREIFYNIFNFVIQCSLRKPHGYCQLFRITFRKSKTLEFITCIQDFGILFKVV